MKILWKNLIWNYSKRYWLLFKYWWKRDYETCWKFYYYPHKKFITQEQYDKFEKEYWEEFTSWYKD